MSLIYDPRYDRPELGSDHIAHFGVKGMKWGVRKERKRGARVRKAYTKSDSVGRGKEATAAKVAQLKVDKAAAMANYKEHISEHNSKTGERVSKMEADRKSLNKMYDDHTDYVTNKAHAKFVKEANKLESKHGKGTPEAKKAISAAEKKTMEKANKKIKEIQDEKAAIDKDYAAGIKKYKAKREKQAGEIRSEMVEQGVEWDAAISKVKSQNTGKSVTTGQATVNHFLTGNPDGRITKSTVVGYGLAAAMIGAMAYDMHKSAR